MNETLKAMVEALKEYGAEYVSADIGEYSIIVTTKETADFIREALDKTEETEVQE